MKKHTKRHHKRYTTEKFLMCGDCKSRIRPLVEDDREILRIAKLFNPLETKVTIHDQRGIRLSESFITVTF